MPISPPLILSAFALNLPYAVSALPHVTIEPLPNDCSPYPSYNATTNSAGPWPVLADSTGASIDGESASIVSFTNDGKDRFGFITLPQPNAKFGTVAPKITLRCTDSVLQAQLRTEWVDVSIASDENWQHSLAWGLPEEGIPVQAYAHVVNGRRVPGVYLGAKGSTTWFFKHNWGGNAGEYFLLRWVGEVEGLGKRQDGPVVDDRDWSGFLKVGS